MKIRELIQKLSEYNAEAFIDVVANNYGYNFSLSYGNFEGCEKHNCTTVSIYVDELNQNESENLEN